MRTYVLILFPFVFSIFLYFIEISLIFQIFFLVSYFWNYCLTSPKILKKYKKPSLHYSFIGLIIRGDLILCHYWPYSRWPCLRRSLSPLIFSFLLSYAVAWNLFFMALLGSFVFEGMLSLYKEDPSKCEP